MNFSSEEKNKVPEPVKGAPGGDNLSVVTRENTVTKPPEGGNEKTRVTDISDIHAEPKAEEGAAEQKTETGYYSTKEEMKKRRGKADPAANTVRSLVKAIAYIVTVTVLGGFLGIFIIGVGNDVFALVKADELVDVTLPEDATLDDVAKALYDGGVIKYPTVFKLYASLRGDNGKFVGGDYTVSSNMDYDELRFQFKEKAVTGIQRITIPEGSTTDEIIDIFLSYGIGTREGFIEELNYGEFDYWFVEELDKNGWSKSRYYRLDGYLFPDTYDFYLASSEWSVINKMLQRFSQIFTESMRSKTEALGYTVDEIVTLASIVEKESYYASDLVLISSVFHNRLNNSAVFPLLQSDATVAYAQHHETGKRPGADEINVNYDTPYNTYLYSGLTPGAIANPGYAALAAALYPSKTDYYFFVSYKSGYTLYAATYADHEVNKLLVKGES